MMVIFILKLCFLNSSRDTIVDGRDVLCIGLFALIFSMMSLNKPLVEANS